MKTLKEVLGIVLVGIIAVVAVVGIIIGAFYLNRWFNWKFGYQAMTQKAIREMVKPEALKTKFESESRGQYLGDITIDGEKYRLYDHGGEAT